ncbi:AAA family ATPase [Mastigocladopsis repens]|uniref:AAA family ATPase n=1 Tax=Mastigocladopsis repens TaxID=221287 RepID=UPI0018DB218A|nr:AAA family ATPase [Mastigocladopsis repens]
MTDLVIEKYIRRLGISLGNKIVSRGFDDFVNPLDFVKHIEQEVLKFTKSWDKGEDFDKWKYQRLIEAIRNIEYTISDPAYKIWKLQTLAQEFGKSQRELEQLYLKSLADFSNEPLKGLKELDEECGTNDREWLLHGFIPKATTILFHAEGGVGKTKLIYELAYNLITGQSWSGHPVTASERRVLCYQTDESPHDMRQALRARGFHPDMNFKYRTNWVIDAIPQLVKDIEEFQPDLIVIDSLTSVNRYSIFEENTTEYARPLLQLVQIANQYGCTVRQMGEDGYVWVDSCKLVALPNPPVNTWYVFESPAGEWVRVAGDDEFEVQQRSLR